MADESKRELILADIATTLAITAGSTYWTTVEKVTRVLSIPQDLQGEARPGILVIASGQPEEIEQQHSNRSVHTMAVGIIGILNRQPGDIGTALNRFMKDITVAMATDTTRGGNASMTWVRSKLDASNAFGPIAVCEMDFAIRYHTDSREE